VAVADVELVIDFLNTVDVEVGTDVLDDSAGWATWLAERDLRPDDRARAVRGALRTAVGEPGPTAPALSAEVRVELAGGTPTVVAQDVVGAVLAAAARLAVLGEWDRIKICPADDCRWAFFDRSRNHSRAWCSMRVCGNREKARAWRERARTNAEP